MKRDNTLFIRRPLSVRNGRSLKSGRKHQQSRNYDKTQKHTCRIQKNASVSEYVHIHKMIGIEPGQLPLINIYVT